MKAQGVKISDDEFAGKVGLHPHYVKRFREVLEIGRKSDLMKRLPELEGWHEVEVDFEEKPTLETLHRVRINLAGKPRKLLKMPASRSQTF